MESLRWILLGAGALLLLGIYLWGLRRQRAGRPQPREEWPAEPVQDWREPTPDWREPTPDWREPAPDWREPLPERHEPAVQWNEPVEVEEASLPAWDDLPDPEPVVPRTPSLPATPAAPSSAMPVRREPTIGGARVPVLDEMDLPSLELEPATLRRAPVAAPTAVERPMRATRDQGTESRDAGSPAASGPKAQKILTVRVTAPAPSRFEGSALLSAIEGLGLVHGRYDIFHRLGPGGLPVFSIANLLEPGTFDPATMASGGYPGVAFFAVLPGPVSGHHALDDLMATARSLADRLGGNLLDERGAMLSVQRMAQLREEVTAFERGLHGQRAG